MLYTISSPQIRGEPKREIEHALLRHLVLSTRKYSNLEVYMIFCRLIAEARVLMRRFF